MITINPYFIHWAETTQYFTLALRIFFACGEMELKPEFLLKILVFSPTELLHHWNAKYFFRADETATFFLKILYFHIDRLNFEPKIFNIKKVIIFLNPLFS